MDETTNTGGVDWDNFDFKSVMGDPFAALSLGVTSSSSSSSSSGPGSPPIDPKTISLDQFPSELLIQIINKLSVQDRIATALERPNDFMNLNRYHLFVDDANRQLQIPTYLMPTFGNAEPIQRPLVLEAIAHGFGVEQIGQILDIYQEVCVARRVNPHVLLNSNFPDNRPAHVPPPGPESSHITRTVQSPLHVAVHHRRVDVVVYLIQRGADPAQVTRYPNQTPFQYALTLASRWWRYFDEYDAERNGLLEDIALELEPYSHPRVYTSDAQDISLEMYLILSGGLQRLALVLLKKSRYQNLTLNDDQIDLIHDRRTEILDEVLVSYPPMPEVLTFLLDDCGAALSEGIFQQAVQAGRLELATATLLWVSRNGVGNYRRAAMDIGRLTYSDENLPHVQRFVKVFQDLGHHSTILSILMQAMYATPESPETKKWLLDNTDSANELTLRHAIALRDMGTTALVLQRMIDSHKSINNELEISSGIYVQGEWPRTPLTFALAQENYHAASQLLSLGANPDLVPANIRHRVRRTRDRFVADKIQNPVERVFRGRQDCQDEGHTPSLDIVVNALNYVFTRMLDDPAHPLPEYNRTVRRNEDVEDDHPDNDSDYLDFVGIYEVL